MWTFVALLVAIIALVRFQVWLNMNPMRCPLCHHINISRRRKTGKYRDQRDEGGDLVRDSTEFVCGLCNGRYWMVWDDFEGRSASISPPEIHG